MLAKTVSETHVTMSKVMEPTDANFLGKVFGGSILSMLDLVAYATASRFAGNVCVTASFDRVDFIEPIEVGELVTCEGFVSFVGRTSVEVTTEVYAENIFEGRRRHTNTSRITMVAIKEGKPIAVPQLVCETAQDKVRFLEGKARRELRTLQRAEYSRLSERLKALPESELDALLASDGIVNKLA